MDAVKYLKESNRMCYSINFCTECPLDKENLCANSVTNGEEEKVVMLVEQWSKEHPLITNRQKFQQVFGRPLHRIKNPTGWWDEEYKPPKEDE